MRTRSWLPLALLAPFALAQEAWVVRDLPAGPPEAPDVALPATPARLELVLAGGEAAVLEPDAAEGAFVRERGPEAASGRTVLGDAGEPDVAQRVVEVILPWDADVDRLSIECSGVEEAAAGKVRVRPLGASGADETEDEGEPAPGPARRGLWSRDEFWPSSPIGIGRPSQFRRYTTLRLLFRPFRYNPVTGELRRVVRLSLVLEWPRRAIEPAAARAKLADTDPRWFDAASSYVNAAEAAAWYRLAGPTSRTRTAPYLVIAPESVVAASKELAAFVRHKTDLGLPVAVVPVEAIAARFAAAELSDSIRAFLTRTYAAWGIEYVLLVGTADPFDRLAGSDDAVGSLPMKMAWPRGDGRTGTKKNGQPAYGWCPTDHYYADLSAEWDVDGDGYAGAPDDAVPSAIRIRTGDQVEVLERARPGFDFDMEVLVGRIPFDDARAVDEVLARTILYERESAAPPAGRRRVYVATGCFQSTADYGWLGRQIEEEAVPEGLAVETWFQGVSAVRGDHVLSDRSLVDAWEERAPGLVVWTGHGNPSSVVIGFKGHRDGLLISRPSVGGLARDVAPFVVQGSCSTAEPEKPQNLAHTILAGRAVTTIAASRVAWYRKGQRRFGGTCTIGDLVYHAAASHLAGLPAGLAISTMRRAVEPEAAKAGFKQNRHNLLTFNLYGDPSVRYVPR